MRNNYKSIFPSTLLGDHIPKNRLLLTSEVEITENALTGHLFTNLLKSVSP